MVLVGSPPIPGASLRSAERPHPQQDWFYSSETPAIVPGGWLYGQSGISGIVVLTNVPSVPVTLRSRKFGFEPVTFVLERHEYALTAVPAAYVLQHHVVAALGQ